MTCRRLRARVAWLRRLESLEFEIALFAGMLRGRLARDPGYVAVQTIPGVGPPLAAGFVAEIGHVSRYAGPEQLACWAGLTPIDAGVQGLRRSAVALGPSL